MSRELKATHPHVDILEMQLDVMDGVAVRSSITETVSRFGRLDVGVNNAGIGGSGRKTHEIPEEEWRKILGVDLDGVWRCQREELKVMVEQE